MAKRTNATSSMDKEQRREYNVLTKDVLALTEKIGKLTPARRLADDAEQKAILSRELTGLYAQRQALQYRREHLFNGRG